MRKRRNIEEHFCPNCGARLEDQAGFDSDNRCWVCTECGQNLYGDNDGVSQYPGVVWHCDECGAILNNQPGFSDQQSSWRCTECDHVNSISEDEIFESEDAWNADQIENGDSTQATVGEGVAALLSVAFIGILERKLSNHAADECNSQPSLEDGDYSYPEDTSVSSVSNEQATSRSVDSRGELKACLIFLLVLFALFGFMALDSKYGILDGIFHKDEIEVPFSSSDIKGHDYSEVEQRFRDAGFENIELKKLDDLNFLTSLITKENSVESVSIAGDANFDKSDYFSPDSKILITYHSKA